MTRLKWCPVLSLSVLNHVEIIILGPDPVFDRFRWFYYRVVFRGKVYSSIQREIKNGGYFTREEI